MQIAMRVKIWLTSVIDHELLQTCTYTTHFHILLKICPPELSNEYSLFVIFENDRISYLV